MRCADSESQDKDLFGSLDQCAKTAGLRDSVDSILTHLWVPLIINREYLNPLEGKMPKIPEKRVKARKTGAPEDWRSFYHVYMLQNDWLKGSHMTKVVWLSNETDYSYCEFVAPNTP